MHAIIRWGSLLAVPLSIAAAAQPETAAKPEPTRIVIECEDMQGVAQDKFGPGSGWQVGRWGEDLYQNMTFGGVAASQLRVAMTDAGEQPAEISSTFDVPVAGTYKVWVKYECPPFFNYAFGVKVEPVDAKGPAVLDKTYGLRESAKQFSFKKAQQKGDLYWNWGIDHDAAEGYNATLAKGRYRITISKTKNPAPAGVRSLDAILITSDLAEVSAPKFTTYPLLDELQRASHVYLRFHNPKGATEPIFINWDHANHRPLYVYNIGPYRKLVKYYDEQGGQLTNWSGRIAPDSVSPWLDVGPTMNTDVSSPFWMSAHAKDAKAGEPSRPFTVDIATSPNEKTIVKSFKLESDETSLEVLVQPDVYRPEGVAYTKKITEIYAELTRELNQEDRLGPLPKKLRLFGDTEAPDAHFNGRKNFEASMEFQEAVGLNTLFSDNPNVIADMLAWGKQHGGIVERSLEAFQSAGPQDIIAKVKAQGLEKQFYFGSFGDEIVLPAPDAKNPKTVEAFRAFLQKRGETPQSLGLAGWDEVKPLAALSGDAAVKVGVLSESKKADSGSIAGLKRLYWYSLAFRAEQGIAMFAERTKTLRTALGNEVQTTANLGSMMPFYWMDQHSFIEAFKGDAMSMAWTEDYTYCQPEASRLIAEFEAGYLRKGASYHDTPMQFFCMPHWPGNNAEQLVQNAVLEWGQNVKDLHFFWCGPDTWRPANYVAYRGGLPTFKAMRTISGMAGLIEDHLLPARTAPARVAVLLSEASDVWETEGKGQGAIEPGSAASNVSQEERKAIWYALRYAGYRVDFVTENDCADGLLKDYSVLYLCGQNLDHKAIQPISDWVRNGGTLFATAGAARKDEFDAPLTALDEVLGRGKALAYERFKGPLRARLELLFVKALDEMKLADGKTLPVFCSREQFVPAAKAQVLATYKDGKPALIANNFGKGRAYYTGTLPGQTWEKAALPVLPQGKGGPHTKPWMTEWLDWDPVAAGVMLMPLQSARIDPEVAVNHRGVVANCLRSDKSTILTVVNLALEADGELKDVELRVHGDRPVTRAWSCYYPKQNLVQSTENNAVVIRLPKLGPADVVVLEP